MKAIFDNIHGFIPLSDFEYKWIYTPWFLRLQQIHQLGAAFRVYPGATHTRFEHSLGVMHLSTKIFDHLTRGKAAFLSEFSIEKIECYRSLLRLASLSHDLGHLPFSHTAEALVLRESCHEAWTLKILNDPEVVRFLKPIIEQGESIGVDAHRLLKQLAVGEKKYRAYEGGAELSPQEKVLAEILSGDFFGSDRMDYLLRDARCTGLSYGFFDDEQLIYSLTVMDQTLVIDMKGIQACESLLMARYFMYERLYQNLKVQAYAYAISFLIESVIRTHQGLTDCSHYLALSDIDILAFLKNPVQDEEIEKQRRAFTTGEGLLKVYAVNEKQKQKLKLSGISDALKWRGKQKSRSFLSDQFLVKNYSNQLRPFSTCSRLQVPTAQEDFVLVDPRLASDVIKIIEEAS